MQEKYYTVKQKEANFILEDSANKKIGLVLDEDTAADIVVACNTHKELIESLRRSNNLLIAVSHGEGVASPLVLHKACNSNSAVLDRIEHWRESRAELEPAKRVPTFKNFDEFIDKTMLTFE